jgi:hypothetical protein
MAKIPKTVKDATWKKYMDNKTEGKCYCCNIETDGRSNGYLDGWFTDSRFEYWADGRWYLAYFLLGSPEFLIEKGSNIYSHGMANNPIKALY